MILLLAEEIDLGRYYEVMNIAFRYMHPQERIAHIDWETTDLSTLNADFRGALGFAK